MKLQTLSAALLISALTWCSLTLGRHYQNGDNYGFFVGVDYLYWKAQEDQLYYATAVPGGIPAGGEGFFRSSRLINTDQCFKANSGVRGELGYAFCSDWDTRLAGTHFKSCSFSSVSVPHGILATPLFPILNLGEQTIGSNANSRWNVKFNTLDWELGRFWDICEEFNMRSHIGLKFAKIKQSQLINYPDLAGGGIVGLIDKCNTFSAVGPRFGLDADWCFWNDLSLVGKIAASLLYGKFNYNDRMVFNFLEDGGAITLPFGSCVKRLRPVVEMFVGIGWTPEFSCLCNNALSFDIAIGYEAQYWWNQMQAFTSVLQGLTSMTGNGDFMLHGLTVHFGLEF